MALPVNGQTLERRDLPTPAKVVFRNGALRNALKQDGETGKIAEIVNRVKENFNAKFRVFEPDVQPAEPNSELAVAEQEYFNENCDQLVVAFAQYLDGGTDDDFEEMLRALGEIKYYQSNSPAVAELTSALREQFSMSNLHVEASERFLSAMASRGIKEDFQVSEYIRGSYARGNGVANGVLSVDLHPNTERAEMSIVLNTNITTSTVGTSRGVDVYTDNYGAILASKRVYVNPNGMFVTSLSSANGQMKTHLNSFNANRPTPFGGAIVRSKIDQELPLAERETTQRVRQRVASELEQQVNEELTALNERIQRMFENGTDPMVRNMSTRTSDDRLYFSCTLGRSWQLAAPNGTHSNAIAYMKDLSREVSFVRAKTTESYAQEYRAPQVMNVSSGYVPPRPQASAPAYNGPIAQVLTAPIEMVAEVATAFNPVAAPPLPAGSTVVRAPAAPAPATNAAKPAMRPVSMQSGTTARAQAPTMRPAISTSSYVNDASNSQYDLLVRFHQSGPINAATVALAGATFGPGADTIDAVLARFPGLDPEDVKTLLTPYEPQGERPLDPEDNIQSIELLFDDVRPFLTRFDNGKVSSVLRISSCMIDGKEWGPIEIRLIYSIEKRGDSYAFMREEVEVLPEGFQEGDSVSARFHTFRRIFIKRLEQTISNEYVIVPISLDDKETGQKRGALIPEMIDVQEGWITAGFRYDSEYAAN